MSNAGYVPTCHIAGIISSSQLPVVARLLSAHLYWHQCCYCVSISISVGGVSGGRGLVAYSALILFKLYEIW